MRYWCLVPTTAAVLAADLAWACTCIWPLPEEARAEMSLAFRGRVLTVRPVEWPGAKGSRVLSKEVTFTVLERFKGPKESRYTVFTGNCDVSEPNTRCHNTCEAPVQAGHEYVVVALAAADADGRTAISSCGTFDVKERSDFAGPLLKELREKPLSNDQ